MIETLNFRNEAFNHCHVPEERAELFSSLDTSSTEMEYLSLLYSLVLCLKPTMVLETGTFRGMGSMFMAKAMKKNGFGMVTSLEIFPKVAEVAKEQLRINALSGYVEVVRTDSVRFLRKTRLTFDFALFDSALPLRCKELRVCLNRNLLGPGTMAALHDTSRLRTISDGVPDPCTMRYWNELNSIPGISIVQFPLSRGLTLVQVR